MFLNMQIFVSKYLHNTNICSIFAILKDKDMTATEVKTVLSNNREIVINFFNENVKEDKFYTLKWFMTIILKSAVISWSRRKNISEKDIMTVMNSTMKNYPQIANGYVSNYQKAVNYFGENKVKQMLNSL